MCSPGAVGDRALGRSRRRRRDRGQVDRRDTNDDLTIPGSDSTAAQDLLAAHFPKEEFGANPIALAVPRGKLTDAANRKVLDAIVKAVKGAPHVNGVISPLAKAGADQLSKDKRFGYLSVTLDIGPTDLDAGEADPIINAAKDPGERAGFQVAAGATSARRSRRRPRPRATRSGLGPR